MSAMIRNAPSPFSLGFNSSNEDETQEARMRVCTECVYRVSLVIGVSQVVETVVGTEVRTSAGDGQDKSPDMPRFSLISSSLCIPSSSLRVCPSIFSSAPLCHIGLPRHCFCYHGDTMMPNIYISTTVSSTPDAFHSPNALLLQRQKPNRCRDNGRSARLPRCMFVPGSYL